MTDELVQHTSTDGIATITLDDGKVNVMSLAMMSAIGRALDRAEADGDVVVLTGRDGVLSAGYDLTLFERPDEIGPTLRAGGELVHRLLGFPRPVVAAANGHTIAQGAFVVLACDVRLGVTGTTRTGLNEVAIGLTIPHYGIEVARARLTTPGFHHATATGTLYGPEEALAAGFYDRLVGPDDLATVAAEAARGLVAVDAAAHLGTKRRTRAGALTAIRDGIDTEFPAA